MDKYEYKLRSEEIKSLIKERDFVKAVEIADTIDWTRVRSVSMLCTISDLYKINRRYKEAKEILLQAYEKHPAGRTILYSLCELCIKTDDVIGAIEYYKEFVQIAPKDSGKFILQYKIYEAQEVSLEERAAVLEELKKREYHEKWGYELAYLYHRMGLGTKCVEECDQLILWFREGRYIKKAMELKMLHQQLTGDQETLYKMMIPSNEKAQYDQQTKPYQSVSDTEIKEYEGADDIQVKTMDMGQYNTLNLQRDLAESMREVLVADNNFAPLYSEEQTAVAQETPQPEPKQKISEEFLEKIFEDLAKENEVENKEEVPPQEPSKIGAGERTEEFLFEISPGEKTEEILFDAEPEEIIEEPGDGMVELSLPAEEEELPANVMAEGPVTMAVEEPAMEEGIEEAATVALTEETVAVEIVEEASVAAATIAEPSVEMVVEEPITAQIVEEVPPAVAVEEPAATEVTEAAEEIRVPDTDWLKAQFEEDFIIEEQLQSGATIKEESPMKDIIPEPIAESTAAPVMEAILEETVEEPVVEAVSVEAVEEPATEATIEEPAAAPAAEAVSVEAVEEPATEATIEEPAAAPAVEAVSVEAVEEPATATIEEPVAAPAMEAVSVEAVAQPASEENFVESAQGIFEELLNNADMSLQEPQPVIEEVAGNETVAEAKADIPQDRPSIREVMQGKSGPDLSQVNPPEEMGRLLSQDLDGQISLVVPESELIEKQITGQMNLADILAEWEKTKKENEEKRKLETTQRVLQQTGTMFTEFEAKMRDGILEKLENNEDLSGFNWGTGEDTGVDLSKDLGVVLPDAMTEVTMESETTSTRAGIYGQTKKTLEDASFEELEELLEKEDVPRKATTSEPDTKKRYDESVRNMTEEELSLFASFVQTKSARMRLMQSLDQISLAAYTGNVFVTGDTQEEAVELAKSVVRDVQMTDRNFSGKVAKVTGQSLNNREIKPMVAKLANGALIIEKASGMDAQTTKDLLKALNQEKTGIVVVLQDNKKAMHKMMEHFSGMKEIFNVHIEVEELGDEALVAYGKKYARHLEYAIDEMGILALHTRIDEMQTADHVVTVADVRDIVDEAIENANRKNIRHFKDVLFAKRYDDDDMIILRERDFLGQ